MPAKSAEPHALIVMRGTSDRSTGSSPISTRRFSGFMNAVSVSPITAGCSKISFSMKWRY